jgi:hypothetical protein
MIILVYHYIKDISQLAYASVLCSRDDLLTSIIVYTHHYTKTNVKLEVCFTATLLDTGEEQAMALRHKAVTNFRVADGG